MEGLIIKNTMSLTEEEFWLLYEYITGESKENYDKSEIWRCDVNEDVSFSMVIRFSENVSWILEIDFGDLHKVYKNEIDNHGSVLGWINDNFENYKFSLLSNFFHNIKLEKQ